MRPWQRAIQYLAMAFAILLVASIIAGVLGAVSSVFGWIDPEDMVLEEAQTFDVTGDISSFKLQISAAEVTVTQGEAFSVKSNLKYLKVENDGGCLEIVETKKGKTYRGAFCEITIPSGMVFDRADLECGAGRVTIESLSAKDLQVDLGAGEVLIGYLFAEKEAEIDGGAGKLTVQKGDLHDMVLDMGVGELILTARLTGNCEVNCGVGSTKLCLLGDSDDYRIDVEKGIGDVSVDGKSLSDGAVWGSGENRLELDGGIGSIEVTFAKE